MNRIELIKHIIFYVFLAVSGIAGVSAIILSYLKNTATDGKVRQRMEKFITKSISFFIIFAYVAGIYGVIFLMAHK